MELSPDVRKSSQRLILSVCLALTLKQKLKVMFSAGSSF